MRAAEPSGAEAARARRRRAMARGALGGLVRAGAALGLVWLGFRAGVLPALWLPLPPLEMAAPGPAALVDLQLARIAADPAACRAALSQPTAGAAFAPVADRPVRDGCGWENAVRLDRAGGARVGADPLACGAAAALALWLAQDVQPAAERHLGARVTAVRHLGTYACRNARGRLGLPIRSRHATAEAIDVAGFALADGRRVSVREDWGRGAAGAFLAEVHGAACRRFRVTLGPDWDAAHRGHLHLDRGLLPGCG